jgi:hypothetical protein
MRAQYAGQDGNSYRYHNAIEGIKEEKRKPNKTKLDLDFELVLSFLNRILNPGN